MPKSYLRFRPGPVHGLINQAACNVTTDAKGQIAIVGQLENAGIWNLSRGMQVNTLSVPGDDAASRTECTSVLLSPSGAQVAIGYADGMVRLFDVSKASLVMALTGHRKAITALRFNRDGTLLLSGSKDTDIIVWDLVSESGLVRFRGHKDEVTDVLLVSAQHGAGTVDLAISSSKDTLIKVWDLRTRTCIQTIVGVRSEVWSLAASITAEGIRILAGAGDNLLRVWALTQRSGMAPLEGTAAASAGSSERDILVPLGTVIRTTHDRAAGVCCTLDGAYIAVQSGAKSVEVFRRRDAVDTSKRTLRRLRRSREKAAKREKDAGTDGQRLQQPDDNDGEDVGADDDTAMFGTSLADLDTAILRLETAVANSSSEDDASGAHSGLASSLGVGIFVLASDELELVGLVQASSKLSSCSIIEHFGQDSAAQGGRRPLATLQLLCALSDNRIEIHTLPLSTEAATTLGTKSFTTASGSTLPLAAFTRSISHGGHRSDVRSVAVSEDGSLALTTSVGEAKVWNAKTGVCLRTLSLATDAPAGATAEAPATGSGKAGSTGLCCAFGPGNRHGFVGTRDGRLVSFDLGSGDRLEEQAAHGGPLWSIAMRPDGKGLCSGGADKEVKFWDFEMVDAKVPDAVGNKAGAGKKIHASAPPAPASGAKVLSLVHSRTLKVGDEVLCVVFSKHMDPAKVLLAASLMDNTVKIFYDDSLRFFLSLYGHKLPVMAMDISADGTLLATGSVDKSVKVWGLDFGDCHRSFPAHSDSVTSVAWVGGTHYFLSASKDKSVRYWDGDRFDRILSLEGYHKGEIWGLALAKDGKFFITVGADRALRTWRRTQEQVFIEEEKELALDAALERGLRDVDGDEAMERADRVGPVGADGLAMPSDKEEGGGPVATAPLLASAGLLSESTTIIAHATKATGKGAERLAEALVLATSEADRWLEYAEDLDEAKASGQGGAGDGLNAPQPNPELLGLTPSAYILRTLRAVRPADVDQVLITLPFADALRLLRFCGQLLRHGRGVELISRTTLLLLRVHGPHIAASPSLLTFVTSLHSSLHECVGAAADAIGYNAAALKLYDASLADLLAGDDFGAVAEAEARQALVRKGDKRKGEEEKHKNGGVNAGKRRKVQML